MIAALRWWYRDLEKGKRDMPSRAELDRGKQILYDAVEKLRATMGGDEFAEGLRDQIKACLPESTVISFLDSSGLDPVAYLKEHGIGLDAAQADLRTFVGGRLEGFGRDLYRELNALTRDWHPDRRRDLLVRYLGFPLWDVLLYPIQALADAGENDTIVVQRMSPYEARVLSTAARGQGEEQAADALLGLLRPYRP